MNLSIIKHLLKGFVLTGSLLLVFVMPMSSNPTITIAQDIELLGQTAPVYNCPGWNSFMCREGTLSKGSTWTDAGVTGNCWKCTATGWKHESPDTCPVNANDPADGGNAWCIKTTSDPALTPGPLTPGPLTPGPLPLTPVPAIHKCITYDSTAGTGIPNVTLCDEIQYVSGDNAKLNEPITLTLTATHDDTATGQSILLGQEVDLTYVNIVSCTETFFDGTTLSPSILATTLGNTCGTSARVLGKNASLKLVMTLSAKAGTTGSKITPHAFYLPPPTAYNLSSLPEMKIVIDDKTVTIRDITTSANNPMLELKNNLPAGTSGTQNVTFTVEGDANVELFKSTSSCTPAGAGCVITGKNLTITSYPLNPGASVSISLFPQLIAGQTKFTLTAIATWGTDSTTATFSYDTAGLPSAGNALDITNEVTTWPTVSGFYIAGKFVTYEIKITNKTISDLPVKVVDTFYKLLEFRSCKMFNDGTEIPSCDQAKLAAGIDVPILKAGKTLTLTVETKIPFDIKPLIKDLGLIKADSSIKLPPNIVTIGTDTKPSKPEVPIKVRCFVDSNGIPTGDAFTGSISGTITCDKNGSHKCFTQNNIAYPLFVQDHLVRLSWRALGILAADMGIAECKVGEDEFHCNYKISFLESSLLVWDHYDLNLWIQRGFGLFDMPNPAYPQDDLFRTGTYKLDFCGDNIYNPTIQWVEGFVLGTFSRPLYAFKYPSLFIEPAFAGSLSNLPISDGLVEITDSEGTVHTTKTDYLGKFMVEIPKPYNGTIIKLSKPGYKTVISTASNLSYDEEGILGDFVAVDGLSSEIVDQSENIKGSFEGMNLTLPTLSPTPYPDNFVESILLNNSQFDRNSLIARLLTWLFSIVSAIATLFLMGSGYTYIASTGNPSTKNQAHKKVIQTLSALILILFVWMITSFVFGFPLLAWGL